jgi:hypothetical protein
MPIAAAESKGIFSSLRAHTVRYLLSRNITVFAFDFAGCGLSEGEFISLGYY